MQVELITVVAMISQPRPKRWPGYPNRPPTEVLALVSLIFFTCFNGCGTAGAGYCPFGSW